MQEWTNPWKYLHEEYVSKKIKMKFYIYDLKSIDNIEILRKKTKHGQ